MTVMTDVLYVPTDLQRVEVEVRYTLHCASFLLLLDNIGEKNR